MVLIRLTENAKDLLPIRIIRTMFWNLSFDLIYGLFCFTKWLQMIYFHNFKRSKKNRNLIKYVAILFIGIDFYSTRLLLRWNVVVQNIIDCLYKITRTYNKQHVWSVNLRNYDLRNHRLATILYWVKKGLS